VKLQRMLRRHLLTSRPLSERALFQRAFASTIIGSSESQTRMWRALFAPVSASSCNVDQLLVANQRRLNHAWNNASGGGAQRFGGNQREFRAQEEEDEAIADEEDTGAAAGEATPTPIEPAKVVKMDVRVINPNNSEMENPPVIPSFDGIQKQLPEWLKEGIRRLNYHDCTPIQAHTMPLVLQGKDLIGLAPTGSGKTVAFAVPSLAGMKLPSDGYPQILVICPVRELAQQTGKVFRSLVAPHGNIRVVEIYGGADRGPQASALWSGADILVATPGRLNDFLGAGDVDFRNLSFLVFDEADRLLDMGFAPQLDSIMEYVDPGRKRQTLMWSATWPREVQTLASNYLTPDRLMVKAGNAGEGGLVVNENISQHVHIAPTHSERIRKLRSLYDEGHIDVTKKSIFFVQKKVTCDEVAYEISRTLASLDIPLVGNLVQPLHGGMSQDKRDRVINQFRAGKIKVLVATDVAARGLDFPDVEHVVNFDPPLEIDSYVHRIGRTGRAGRKGKAHTFVMGPSKWLPDLIKYLERSKQEIPSQLHSMARESGFKSGFRGRGGRGRGGFGGRGGGGGGFGGRNSGGGNFGNGGFGNGPTSVSRQGGFGRPSSPAQYNDWN
jgi:ATP-dependent RNA helicase DDX5/DBP2